MSKKNKSSKNGSNLKSNNSFGCKCHENECNCRKNECSSEECDCDNKEEE